VSQLPVDPAEALALFAAHSTDLLCIATVDGRFDWVGEGWSELGFDVDALLGRPFLDFVHPDDVDATVAEVVKLASGQVRTQFVNRYRRPDGDYVALEWSGSVADDGRIYCIARDITGRLDRFVQQEGQLAQLALAEDIGQMGTWRYDLREHTMAWSPQIYRLHGMSPGDGMVSGDLGMSNYHPDDRPKIQAAFDEGIPKGAPIDFEARLMQPDGSVRWVHGRAQPLVEDGEFVGLAGVLRDITDERALRDQLLQADKLASIGTLAAGMAHEINNPLSYVMLGLDLLQGEVHDALRGGERVDPVAMGQTLDDVLDGVERIRRIVAGLRTYSRAKEPQLSTVDVAAAVRSARRLCANTVEHHADLVVDVDEAARHVHADEGQLVQVLVNLLINGVHAVQEAERGRGRLVVRAKVDGHRVALSVSDDGVGMSEATRRRCLEPFFTTREAGQGTGLGLYLARGIAEAGGGRLGIDSELGVGTTVTLWLPSAEEPTDTTFTPPDEVIDGRPTGRVLVIDDQPRVAEAVARSLEPHEVTVCIDPHQALARLQAGESFDLVLCDLMMPTMRGQDLYEQAPDPSKAAFCFLTGGTFTDDARAFAEAMGDRVVAKPPKREQLRRLVRRVLQRA
jgi:PAS domain S-box-containing protein